MKPSPPYRIALIAPYFGKWPAWMPAFLLTCAANPDIDWILPTDCGEPAGAPPNVRCIPSSLAAINALATRTLGFDVHLQRPYKLCDLKIGYGLLFEDLLRPYAFWGHCDIDILWGRIRRFLPDRHLERYDILSSRPDALAGHFCIYRNEPRINRLCLEVPGWPDILNDNARSYMLDEAGYVELLRRKIAAGEPLRVDWHRNLATSGSDQKPLLLAGQPVRWRRGRPCDAQGKRIMLLHWLFRGRPMHWIRGRAVDSYGRERMYLHFHLLKNGFTQPCIFRPDRPPERLVLDRHGIHA